MKKCELCNSVARVYCDSDLSALCWKCDEKVHSANFIVTRHTRTLLCKVCQCLTQWIGSGARFGPTLSVCDNCFRSRKNPKTITKYGDGNEDDHSECDSNDQDDEDEDDEDINQVVPLYFSPTF